MDDRLIKIIDAGAVDGAQDVYANYDEFVCACNKAKADYEAAIEEIREKYCEVIKLHDLVESVKNSIINRLDKKE